MATKKESSEIETAPDATSGTTTCPKCKGEVAVKFGVVKPHELTNGGEVCPGK
jgi:hypothetical protein